MAQKVDPDQDGHWSDDGSLRYYKSNPCESVEVNGVHRAPNKVNYVKSFSENGNVSQTRDLREPSKMRKAKSAKYAPLQENEKQYQVWSAANRYVIIGFIGGVSITLAIFGIFYIQNTSHQTELLETTRQNYISISNQRYLELKECGATLRSSWNGNNDFVKESIKKENEANRDIAHLKQEVAKFVKELARCDEEINQLRGTWWSYYGREIVWSVSIIIIVVLVNCAIISMVEGSRRNSNRGRARALQ